jgi:FMN-dependent NADH-azoreductase
MKILQINSSARSADSQSTRLAKAIVSQLAVTHRNVELTVRDLAVTPHPVLDEATLGALYTPADKRTPEQGARVALDDALIAEIQAADILVLGAPMYNFGVTVQLKSWFDAIARANVTFKYTATGPEGLLKGKKVYVATTRGGMHKGGATDSQVPYLKTMLGFLGMSDVQFIYAEGMGMGPEAVQRAQDAAQADIVAVVA